MSESDDQSKDEKDGSAGYAGQRGTWPSWVIRAGAPADADAFRDKPNKYEQFFSTNPGNTD